jgi:actin-like ATPase involved in cell morphogenesis
VWGGTQDSSIRPRLVFPTTLAIDLGTAYTLCLPRRGSGIVDPSRPVVAVARDGRGVDKVRAVGKARRRC